MTTTVSKSLRLPAEVDASLKATAQREGRSENAVIVDAVRRYTADRDRRRREILERVVTRDAVLLDRLAR